MSRPKSEAKRIAGKRRMGREMAVQMLYQTELGDSSPREVVATFDRAEYLANATRGGKAGTKAKASAGGSRTEDFVARRDLIEEAFEYARQLFGGAVEHRDEIDALIRGQADNWRLERMPAVDRNILRLALYEILHEDETPALVVVDEAIELAKRFGSEQSGRFINGLLDGFLKKRQPQTTEK